MVLSKVACSNVWKQLLTVEVKPKHFRAVAKTKVLRLECSVGHQGISAEDLQSFQADCFVAKTN